MLLLAEGKYHLDSDCRNQELNRVTHGEGTDGVLGGHALPFSCLMPFTRNLARPLRGWQNLKKNSLIHQGISILNHDFSESSWKRSLLSCFLVNLWLLQDPLVVSIQYNCST